MLERLIITVSPTGDVSIEAQGYKGKSCEDATKFLETALGQRTDQTKKPEYHQEVGGSSQQNVS